MTLATTFLLILNHFFSLKFLPITSSLLTMKTRSAICLWQDFVLCGPLCVSASVSLSGYFQWMWRILRMKYAQENHMSWWNPASQAFETTQSPSRMFSCLHQLPLSFCSNPATLQPLPSGETRAPRRFQPTFPHTEFQEASAGFPTGTMWWWDRDCIPHRGHSLGGFDWKDATTLNHCSL